MTEPQMHKNFHQHSLHKKTAPHLHLYFHKLKVNSRFIILQSAVSSSIIKTFQQLPSTYNALQSHGWLALAKFQFWGLLGFKNNSVIFFILWNLRWHGNPDTNKRLNSLLSIKTLTYIHRPTDNCAATNTTPSNINWLVLNNEALSCLTPGGSNGFSQTLSVPYFRASNWLLFHPYSCYIQR